MRNKKINKRSFNFNVNKKQPNPRYKRSSNNVQLQFSENVFYLSLPMKKHKKTYSQKKLIRKPSYV
jgi:hypothetical protein